MQRFLLPFFLFLCLDAFAQNVGIGTPTPTNKLQVVGSVRTDTMMLGLNNGRAPLSFAPTLGQKVSFWDDLNGNGSTYGMGVQSGLLQFHAYSTADNIGFGVGSSANFTERMRITGLGNVGINTSDPAVYGHGGTNSVMELSTPAWMGTAAKPNLVLSTPAVSGYTGGVTWVSKGLAGERRTAYVGTTFESAAAVKLSFYTRNGAGQLLENMILSGEGGLRIAGPSAASAGTTLSLGGFGNVVIDAPGTAGGRLMIKENGNTGIGQPNPSARLDVNGDLNVTGAIKINGNAGVDGKVLTSNGAGRAADWVSATAELYQNIYQFDQPSNITTYVYQNSGPVDIAGLSQTFALAQPCKLLITMGAAGRSVSAFVTSHVFFHLFIDGQENYFFQRPYTLPCLEDLREYIGPRMVTLGAGTHTIKMKVTNNSITDANIFGNYLLIIAIPQ